MIGPRVSVMEIRLVEHCPCLEEVERRVVEIPAAMVENFAVRIKPPTKPHAPAGQLDSFSMLSNGSCPPDLWRRRKSLQAFRIVGSQIIKFT